MMYLIKDEILRLLPEVLPQDYSWWRRNPTLVNDRKVLAGLLRWVHFLKDVV